MLLENGDSIVVSRDIRRVGECLMNIQFLSNVKDENGETEVFGYDFPLKADAEGSLNFVQLLTSYKVSNNYKSVLQCYFQTEPNYKEMRAKTDEMAESLKFFFDKAFSTNITDYMTISRLSGGTLELCVPLSQKFISEFKKIASNDIYRTNKLFLKGEDCVDKFFEMNLNVYRAHIKEENLKKYATSKKKSRKEERTKIDL